VAPYGLATLVTGGAVVATKLGLFTKLAKLAVVFWKLLDVSGGSAAGMRRTSPRRHHPGELSCRRQAPAAHGQAVPSFGAHHASACLVDGRDGGGGEAPAAKPHRWSGICNCLRFLIEQGVLTTDFLEAVLTLACP
jgi:hypothetical protein